MTRVLARSSQDATHLHSLFHDEHALDHLLDHPTLRDALIDETGSLQVSPAFYFYLLTRDVLKRAQLEDRTLCDYIAGVLTEFSRMTALQDPGAKGSQSYAYVSDLLIALQKLPPDQAYQLRVHIGNFSLFMTGIFPGRVEAQCARHGAPGLRFYETIGQSAFHEASHTSQARREELNQVYESLADQFHRVRLALNQMAENTLHFHSHAL